MRFIIGLVTCGIALVLGGCKWQWGSIGYNQGYAPEQPIPYSHELHAGTYKIPCLFCHATAETSNHAAIPPVQVCMNCHMTVAVDKPDIQKLSKAYAENQPIPWVKVHRLPDFVKFPHAVHVKKFGSPESCQTCHGPVQTMKVMYQYNSLSMQWCLDCHKRPEHQGSVNCSACHR